MQISVEFALSFCTVCEKYLLFSISKEFEDQLYNQRSAELLVSILEINPIYSKTVSRNLLLEQVKDLLQVKNLFIEQMGASFIKTQ